MEVTIEMEKRSCVVCGKPFKVMTKSPQKECNDQCRRYGTAVPGARKKQSKPEKLQTESVVVSVTKATKSSAKMKSDGVVLNLWPTQRRKGSDGESDITKEIKTKPTEEELNLQEKTGSESVKTAEEHTKETGSVILPTSASEEIKETLPVLLEDSQNSIEKAALDSMSLLSKSNNRLFRLMKESVSDSDLKRSEQGTQRVPEMRLDAAIRCANALAQGIQVQVNLLKECNKVLGARK